MKGLRGLLFLFLIAIGHTPSAGQVALTSTMQVAVPGSGLSVQKLTEDSFGFLWLATNQGVFRFDGKNLYQPDWLKSLPNSPISYVTESSGILFIGYEDGKIAWKDLRNQLPPEHNQCSDKAISAALVDTEGNLWVGTNGDGIFLYTHRKWIHIGLEEGLPDPVVHSIAQVGTTFCAGTDLGLALIKLDGPNIQCEVLTIQNGLDDNLITALESYSESKLLIGTHKGSVSKLDVPSKEITPFIETTPENSDPIKNLFLANDELWVLTNSGQWWVTDIRNKESMQRLEADYPNELGTVYPTDVLRSRQGLLLICTGNHLLHASDPGLAFLYTHEEKSLSNIRAMLCDELGMLWLSDGKSLLGHSTDFFEKEQFSAFPIETDDSKQEIISIANGTEGTKWVGTFGSGIAQIWPNGKTVWYTEKNGLTNNSVLGMTMHNGSLWLATLGGLGKVDFNPEPSFTSFGSNSPLGSNYVYTVQHSSNGTLWIGTDGRGLVNYTNGIFEFLLETYPESGHSVLCLTEDESGKIWFYTLDKGLQLFDGKLIRSIPVARNGILAEVLALSSISGGGVILYTTQGIAIMSNFESTPYYISPAEELTSDYLNVIARDAFGRVWIGMHDALCRITPSNRDELAKPSTRLSSMLVMLEPTDSSIHSFPYSRNHFTFGISGLWYRHPEDVKFLYYLEGYDLGWNESAQNQIVYSQLKPGDYTLRVKSFIGKPSPTDDELAYSFTIHPPFWLNWWFIVLGALLLTSVSVAAFRIRIRGIQKKEAAERELLRSQFETLRNQVNPHFLFNSFNTLIALIDIDKQEATDYVERLSDYFRHILQNRDKELIPLSEELDQARTYLFLQKKRFGENLQLDVRVEEQVLHSQIPPMTLQILMENAIKHNVISSEKVLKIELFNEALKLVVRNNFQEKKNKEMSTGVGLKNVRERYQILGGNDISVNHKNGYFWVELPLIQST